MIEVTVQISEEDIKQYVLRSLMADYERDRSMVHTLITRAAKEAVREVIYKNRAEIEDRIVAQAASSCKSKALSKLVASLGDSDA